MFLPGYVTLRWPSQNFIFYCEVQLFCPAVPFQGALAPPSPELLRRGLTLPSVGISGVSAPCKTAPCEARHFRGTSTIQGSEVANQEAGKQAVSPPQSVELEGEESRHGLKPHTSATLVLGSAEDNMPLKAFLHSPSEPFTLAYFCSGHTGLG